MMGTVAEQGIILSHDQTWNPWMLPVIGLLAGITLCTWPIIVRLKQFSRRITHLLSILSAVGLAGTVGLAPLLWTCSSLHPDVESGLPVSGPLQGDTRPAVTPSADPHLIAYLQQHRAGATFLVATVDTGAAVPIIFSTGAPVMALGGYTGYDPILTPATLAESVAKNKVRAFYIPSNNLTPQQRQQLYPNVLNTITWYTNRLTQWVSNHCRAVPPDQWSASSGAIMVHLSTMQLFDCSEPTRR